MNRKVTTLTKGNRTAIGTVERTVMVRVISPKYRRGRMFLRLITDHFPDGLMFYPSEWIEIH
jgi:hypothetical protein